MSKLTKEEFYTKLEELYQKGLKDDSIFNEGIGELIDNVNSEYISGHLSAIYGVTSWDNGIVDVYEEFIKSKNWLIWDEKKDGTIEFDMYDGDCKVTVDVTSEQKDKIANRIIEYCKKYKCISGEKLHQNDDCIIYAPGVLSDIIDDILEFKEEWKK